MQLDRLVREASRSSLNVTEDLTHVLRFSLFLSPFAFFHELSYVFNDLSDILLNFYYYSFIFLIYRKVAFNMNIYKLNRETEAFILVKFIDKRFVK